MRAGKRDAGEQHGVAAAKLFAHLRQAGTGEIGVELMEGILGHRPSRQPAREVKSCGGESGVSWADAFSQVQAMGLVVKAKGRAAIRLEHAEILGDEQL